MYSIHIKLIVLLLHIIMGDYLFDYFLSFLNRLEDRIFMLIYVNITYNFINRCVISVKTIRSAHIVTHV